MSVPSQMMLTEAHVKTSRLMRVVNPSNLTIMEDEMRHAMISILLLAISQLGNQE